MRSRKILYSLDQIPKNCRVALYGSGIISSLFRTIMGRERRDVDIVCLVNTFSEGFKDGVRIIKVDSLSDNSHLYDMVIITSTLWNEIEDELIKRDHDFFVLSNALIHLLYNSLSSLGSFHYDEADRAKILKRLDKILSCFESEADKNAYRILMGLRLGHDENESLGFFKRSYDKHKKIYLDYLDLDRGGTIIEGGVANGADSINFYEFLGGNKKISIYGFEPFIEEFNNGPNGASLKEKGMKIYPQALWNKNEELSFNIDATSSGASSISRNASFSDHKVKGITIDSFVEINGLKSVDLIKLDIEGAELEALQGAKDTIKKFKPQLALSLYHKKEHLYEIPEYCKSLHCDYKFKLGFYCPTFLDTVLYALP